MKLLKSDIDVAALVAADAPLAISAAAQIFHIDKSHLKQAASEYRTSRGRFGLRHFSLPGSDRIRVRPSAIRDWFSSLEEREAL